MNCLLSAPMTACPLDELSAKLPPASGANSRQAVVLSRPAEPAFTAKGASVESFSTRGVPAARRLAFWNEIASDTFAAMEVRPHDARSFYGRLDRERVG